MQISPPRHRFASHALALSPAAHQGAVRDLATPATDSPAPSSAPARAAYSHVTDRLAQRLNGPAPEDASAQPRSLFRRALQRIQNTLLGA